MTQANIIVTKPIYATVGAGDALYEAVNGIVDRVRDRTNVDVNSRVEEARERLSNIPADVQDQIDALRGRLSGLPSDLPDDLAELRDRFTPDEFRRTVDQYYRQLLDLYSDLAVRGEETVDRLRTNPGFDERFDKVEDIYSDVVTRAEDVLNRVSDQARGLLGREDEGAVDIESVVGSGLADESARTAGPVGPVPDAVAEPAAVVDAEVIAVNAEDAERPAPSAAQAPAEPAAKAESAPAKKAPAKKAPAKSAAKKTTPAKK
ncbi:hypothetical protein [Nocardia vermiculata]|uniref:Heparin-binding hemagglutinin n=1 Tax=Nocardia vermiculata TaxID=257274 RepID=A0A846Y888_9NOCA|nr:hypothetical protein [Nocardia vermiculata]NKY54070.1 heparin-binding hemagglutinin [Nocardia vermiculata]